MFGFLQADPCDRQYRRLYAGCCSFQHRRFGIGTLPLLSYEGVFLYVLAADAGACLRPDESAATCCRLRRNGPGLHSVDDALAMFCSSFGLLLASVKLEDDVRDDGSLPARLALWRLKSRIERAKGFFESLDPGFRERTEHCIAEHLQRERAGSRPSLEEYAEPTADAFAYLFGLYARVLPAGRVSETWLREVGAAVGRAIICFDCAVDWERDRRRRRFNPLPDRHAVSQALLTSQRWLADVGWRCCEAFGPQSQAASVAGATFHRIQGRVERAGATPPSPPGRTRRKWLVRRGDCDCCCDASCCDASCCDAGCGDANGCDGCQGPKCSENSFDAFICCCPDCGPGCDCGSSKSKKRKSDVHASGGKRQGWRGHTLSLLNPSGVVLFGEERCPARAEFGWIAAGAEVEVVRDEPFGVVVRPSSSLPPQADVS